MKALVTGASSGIGEEIAYYLDSLGYEIFITGKSEEKLKKVASNINNIKSIIPLDLSDSKSTDIIYDRLKGEKIDLIVNNAGFGLFGFFDETDIDRELDMINVNIVAVHKLTKLFLKDMVKNNQGHILNVASSAGFLAGPYLSTYYASKNYVLKLTMAINHELKVKGSRVSISALCPGPVNTNFNNVAGGFFKTKALDSKYVAKYAVDKCLKNKMIIVPSFKMKCGIFFNRFLPYRLSLKIIYIVQKNKTA